MESLLRVVRSTGLIQLIGEIDISNTDEVRSLLADEPGPVQVDLSRVGFIDARGLKVLVDATHRSEAAIRLRAIPQHIIRMIEILGLDEAERPEPAPAEEVLTLSSWRRGRVKVARSTGRPAVRPAVAEGAVVLQLRTVPTIAPPTQGELIASLAASCSRWTQSMESRSAAMERSRAALKLALSQLMEQRASMRLLMAERRDLLRELDRLAGPAHAA